MKISYHGHSCVRIETSGKQRIFIDPFITGNLKSDLSASQEVCDYILITHAHNDHIGDAEDLARRSNATIISTLEIADFFEKRGLQTFGLQPGGGYDFSFGRVTLTPAIHGSTYEENGEAIPLGVASGILLTCDGSTLYHAGDTAFFSDMKDIGEQHDLDVAFLPIGDVYTMGIRDAVRAANLLGAKRVVPIHYNTFPLIEQDPLAFVNQIENGHVMEVGDVIDVKERSE